MSLYDDATLVCLAKGAAGKDGVVYNIKPEEKLKPTELLANGGFDNTDDWALDPGGEVSISGGKLVFTDAVGNDYRRAKSAAAVFEDGKKYRISFTVTDFVRSSTSIKLKVQEDDNKTIIDVEGNGNFSAIYEGQATEEIQFKVSAPTTDTLSCKVDNVSVKEVEQEALDFTFTRGSNLTATRVGPSGYIEKGRENLFTQSNEFDGDDWDPQNLTVTSGQSGYDGSINAFKLTVEVGESGANVGQDFTQTGVKTFSVYAKGSIEDGTTGLRFFGNESGGSNNVSVFFVLTGDGSIYGTPNNVIDTNIEKIGSSGWYRCSVTFDKTLSKAYIYVSNGAGGNFTDDTDGADTSGTGSILIQNAQVEVGLVATDYIESGSTTGEAGILEDSPRFDYTGGGCPTWLGEPNRINLVKNSEYLGDYTDSNATITTNALTSPEGLDNATTINVTSNSGSIYAQSGDQLASVTAETQYTFSFYVKQGTNTENYLAVRDQSAEVFISEDVAYTASSSEWKRIEHTFTTPAGCTSVRLYPSRYDSGGQGTTHLFGIQLEEGSYATSYIPNYGASGGATRNVEQTDVSNLQSNGIITDTQGTFFIDVPDYSTTAVQWDLMSSNFYFALRAAFFANTMTVYKRVLNTQSNIRNINSSDVPSLATTKRRKLALSWNGTSLITSINGISFDDTIDSSIAPELDKIRRANWTSTKVSTDQLLVFDKQLTKEELNELTSIS